MTDAKREAQRAASLEQDLGLLIPIAKRLASRAALKGGTVTVENVKRAAAHLCLAYSDRAYSARLWGCLMHRAGLAPTRLYERTQRIGRRGGNLCRVWRAA